MTHAEKIINRFGQVEDDQKYTKLVDLFTDDAVYYDPFAGAQIGRQAIFEFMSEMERVIPKMGVYFSDWETSADSHVGWAKWNMVVPLNQVNHPISGQSLYRVRDGKVCFVADYVDAVAYAKIRPDRRPDAAGAAVAHKGTTASGSAEGLTRALWQEREESWSPIVGGVVSVSQIAVEETVAWTQWSCRTADATYAGWSLHRIDATDINSFDYWQ